ncbi:MAG: PH domain-containing protein [Patescibacteria group bacterium]
MHQHFEGQREGEEVLLVIHRHWFNLLAHLFTVVLLSVVAIGSILLMPFLFTEILLPEHLHLFLFLENTFFVFLWIYGFLVWIDYYFDVWIVTNERIVNIEQKGLFVRHISELNFSRIQDVTSTVEGIIPTILNFGDVFIQTAGEQERFTFRQVPDPLRIKDTVMRLAKGSLDTDLRNIAASLQSREA